MTSMDDTQACSGWKLWPIRRSAEPFKVVEQKRVVSGSTMHVTVGNDSASMTDCYTNSVFGLF